jgi:hypothetical protein
MSVGHDHHLYARTQNIVAALNTGNLDEAEKHFKEAINKKFDHPKTRYHYGLMLQNQVCAAAALLILLTIAIATKVNCRWRWELTLSLKCIHGLSWSFATQTHKRARTPTHINSARTRQQQKRYGDKCLCSSLKVDSMYRSLCVCERDREREKARERESVLPAAMIN